MSMFAFTKPTGCTERCDYGKHSAACLLAVYVLGAIIVDSFGIHTLQQPG